MGCPVCSPGARGPLEAEYGRAARTLEELAALRDQLASAREELATEHARSRQLQTRLMCTEELLTGYHACRQEHEAESQTYWECVQDVLAGDDKCQNAHAQNEVPGR